MKTSAPAPAVLDTSVATPDSPEVENYLPATPVQSAPAHKWNEWVAFDHARILLPQFVFWKGNDPLSQIYRLSLEEGEPRKMAGAWARFWTRPAFALVVLRQMWIFYRRTGAFVKSKYGVSALQQFRDMWYCAWNQNQSPRHYYWRKFYLIPDRREWLKNLEHRQVNNLLNHFNRNLPITKVTNKVQFYQHCVKHNLPTSPVLAWWDTRGQLTSTAPAPVAADVFLKPTSDYGSVGIMAIVWNSATKTHRFKGMSLGWSDLLKAIGELAATDGKAMLLQRRLANSERNSIYGDTDICNARVVTGRAPDGEITVIGAFVRLPSSLTTTGHDRNIMIASMDVDTGRMEPGRFRETKLGDYPVHPDTGAPIENRAFAGWDEMRALAIRGHQSYPWMPFIGWDVVDSKDGVILLEANAYWGGDCVQLPGAMPLGETRFAEIYLKNFEKFYGTNTPAHRFAAQ